LRVTLTRNPSTLRSPGDDPQIIIGASVVRAMTPDPMAVDEPRISANAELTQVRKHWLPDVDQKTVVREAAL
jgi:hypothetical protein